MNKTQKNIIITGSEGFIGKSLCKFLKKKKYNLICIDKIKQNKKNYYRFDLSNIKGLELYLKNNIKKKFKNIYGLINLAANQVFNDFEKRSIDEINDTLSVNISSNIMLTKFCFVNYFKKQKYGNIINISSIYATRSPNMKIYNQGDRKSSEVYGASKAAVALLTKYYSNYMSAYNVKVNCISPGGVYNKKVNNKKFKKRYSELTNNKRMASVDEIINLIEYLLGKKSSYINGENIFIDGGYNTK